jgi:predicted nucleic acid-binding protein
LYLLDSNVISDLRRPERANRGLLDWAAQIGPEDAFVSVITVLELERGTQMAERKSPDLGRALRGWLNTLIYPRYQSFALPVSLEISRRAAAFHALPTVELADHLIAATALVHGLTLITRNTGDFAGTGVALINPWDG